MTNVLHTLFYPFNQGLLEWPDPDDRVLFLNAQYSPELSHLKDLSCQQYFKPYAAALENNGYHVFSDIRSGAQPYEFTFLILPKAKIEAEYMLAQALSHVKKPGKIICAADNKAGGSRIKKMLQSFGIKDVQQASKNKARVCWATCETFDQKALSEALTAGAAQDVLDGIFISRPGIFGWDKIDQGSKILFEHMPEKIKGRGADFGCGYGYLGRNILQRYASIKELYSIDADHRAVEACRINLETCGVDVVKNFLWADLTQPFSRLKNLDFIVMNPPFHEGKKTDMAIGKTFILTAHHALCKKGVLYMVANAHLPYENILSEKFFTVHKLFEGEGFKVFAASK